MVLLRLTVVITYPFYSPEYNRTWLSSKMKTRQETDQNEALLISRLNSSGSRFDLLPGWRAKTSFT